MWGANDRGQLGLNENLSQRKEPCVAVPMIVESMLGRGLSSFYCRYNQTFWGNSEPGYYISIEGDIFKMWKNKMKRFEEKNLTKANNTYRNIKRAEKQLGGEKGGAGKVDQKGTPIRAPVKYHGAQQQ